MTKNLLLASISLLLLSTCIISVPIIKDGSNITINQKLNSQGKQTNE